MYLIVGNEKICYYLSKELSLSNIVMHAMPCVQLTPDVKIINQFKQQINNFDIVIITSPTAIDYISDAFKYADRKIIFIVSGLSSYIQLRQYTENKIYKPDNDSGSMPIISQLLECMDLRQKKIAIIQGQNANHQIQDYLKLNDSLYTSIIVYDQRWLDLDIQFLKKLLLDNSLQGIILTSSSYAKYLFTQAQKFGCYDILQSIEFITLHNKIKKSLQSFGVRGRIFVSNTVSKESLIDLIRKLHDRHSKYSES